VSSGVGAQWVGTIGATTVLSTTVIVNTEANVRLQIWKNASGTYIQAGAGSPVAIASTNLPAGPCTAMLFSTFTSAPSIVGSPLIFDEFFAATPQQYPQT